MHGTGAALLSGLNNDKPGQDEKLNLPQRMSQKKCDRLRGRAGRAISVTGMGGKETTEIAVSNDWCEGDPMKLPCSVSA